LSVDSDKKYEYTGDSVVVKTYNEIDILDNKEVYHYNSNNQIVIVNCYAGENSIFVEQKEYEYQDRILTKINAYLPEIFTFLNGNINEHETVSENAIWTKYKYGYNENQTAYFMINLPETKVECISENAIILKVSEWTEYVDGMGINDSTINHIDTIYTSTFEYDSDGLISKEYRNSSDDIDTLEYIYSTEIEWIKN
jgi:hypothetical protein